ncbi:MAG: ABC transporter ATP-binding protein [Rhodobacteraceae bacterium]|nr:ABC transporter ATP-binding protein [Paracoccaceae bacterium]
MICVATRGLARHFGGIQAINGIDLDIPMGQTRALIGPNGAGKSTLVGVISGRIAPSTGTIHFRGQDITRLPTCRRIRLGIAYTFQITSVFARLSVFENVALSARRIHGSAHKTVNASTRTALERLGLADRARQLAGDQSYGHQRLLEIAMGLVQDPDLFILDEPTQGLAASEVEDFKTLIRSLRGSMTILLIEHNMGVVMETADTITVLDQGRVLTTGTPAEIRANAAVQACYLGRSHAAG